MEILSLDFLAGLLAIIVIDLVLAGDNAIVIALASRSLPRQLQRRAIVWGAVGAIVVRSTMTLAVVWLLRIPGLMLLGGMLLVWIAYGLLLPENGAADESKVKAAASMRGAIQTIVIADTVMGLDNVLAVAGAAHGSYLLVVLGLLISVPIVVWGSTIMLHWIERHPPIIYVGAAVLAWTAAKMITGEPLLKSAFNANQAATLLTYMVLIGSVLWAGFVRNHRQLAAQISDRLSTLARQSPPGRIKPLATEGEPAMQKILVPVDGSRNDEHAIRQVANEHAKGGALEVHLLNVQPQLSRHIARFIASKARASFHHDEAEKALQPAGRLLEKFGVPHSLHARVGAKAAVIVEEAQRLGVDRIVMSTARKNSLTRMLEDSTTNKVLELTRVPVEVVAGESVSQLERYGLPAGLAVVLALLVAATVD